MPRIITILRFDEETGNALVEFKDDDGTIIKTGINVPYPEDSGTLIDTDYILGFLSKHWPRGDFKKERAKKNNNFSAGTPLVGVEQDVTARIPIERTRLRP